MGGQLIWDLVAWPVDLAKKKSRPSLRTEMPQPGYDSPVFLSLMKHLPSGRLNSELKGLSVNSDPKKSFKVSPMPTRDANNPSISLLQPLRYRRTDRYRYVPTNIACEERTTFRVCEQPPHFGFWGLTCFGRYWYNGANDEHLWAWYGTHAPPLWSCTPFVSPKEEPNLLAADILLTANCGRSRPIEW